MDTQIDTARRLLVVDDEPVQCLIVSRAMTAFGFATECATSLDEASHRIGKDRYDVIVLDLSLGEQEGISLLRLIADSGADPLLIFISRLDERVRAASTRLAAALGIRVAGALAKPFGHRRCVICWITRQGAGAGHPRPAPPPTPEELRDALDSPRDRHRVPAEGCLVRWTRGRRRGAGQVAPPTARPIPPDVFIPLAEQSGLIVPLTQRILEDALAACQRWRRHHPACSVAVNVSPLLLANAALPDEMEATLLRHGLAPGALIAEITESTFIANPLMAMEMLTRLRIKGIGLSMDDFGTGYSSLLTLLRLPFTELKIDRSFIASCETDKDAWKIIRRHDLPVAGAGASVVAEGIETAALQTGCAPRVANRAGLAIRGARCRSAHCTHGSDAMRGVG